jgi:hypothetical protein
VDDVYDAKEVGDAVKSGSSSLETKKHSQEPSGINSKQFFLGSLHPLDINA